MPWSAIITALIQTLLPILVDWLTSWLSSRLNQAASEIAPVTAFAGNNRQATAALFDRAISNTPLRNPARRFLLRMLKNKAVARADDFMTGQFSLGADEQDELRELGMAADND